MYLPPVFKDNDRLAKLKAIFPKIDAIYGEYAKKNRFPGHAYGIILDGKLVHSQCGGMMDLKNQHPVTPHAMFRIASMTKSFIAMALLKLRDDGLLRFDDPVNQYIDEFPLNPLTNDSKIITISDLLTHSSGLPFDDPWADRELDMTAPQFKALLKKGLNFATPTGTSYEYSSLNYALLGEIINKVSNIPYEKYIADHIWQRVGMTGAVWDFADIPNDLLVRGYRKSDREWREEPHLSSGAFSAIGGIITSIESFSRYVALHQGAWPPRDDPETYPLKRSSIREMHQPKRFVDIDSNFCYLDGRKSVLSHAYGYGLRWIRDSGKQVFVGHSGGLPGFGSNWLMMPEYGLGVVFFANLTYAETAKINLCILDELVRAAALTKRLLPPSNILKERQEALLKLFLNLEVADLRLLFAKNFFLDRSIDAWKKETTELFAKAGKIQSVEEIIPEGALKASFSIKCETMKVRVSFSLTPENPPLIQHLYLILMK